MKKKLLALVILFAIMLVFVGCSSSSTQPETPEMPMPMQPPEQNGPPESMQPSEGSLNLTLEQLAQYNGQNGEPAYVAVDEIIYDVSSSSYWVNGNHDPCGTDATAGHDLSELIKQAPAGMLQDLETFPVVGHLVPSS
jgi:predicted heme/steroid binding protein